MKRALFPPTENERADLRRACEADLRHGPVWIAMNGAAIQTTPKETTDARPEDR
jgi:hypothetical protein